MMGKARLEAFSDGVLAIIITIMVLEMKVPHGTGLAALEPLIPVFLSYVLSFVYLGIYWSNHHHLMHAARHVNGVLPTTIDTLANRASTPKGDPSFWARPESIAETLLFLASDKATQISGAAIPVGTGGGETSMDKP